MRKILVPFALMGLCSLPMVACDVQGDGDATTSTNPTTTNDTTDTVQTTKYYGLVVDDSEFFDGRCATSSSKAHGADIDAVELSDGTNSLGYFDTVIYQPGTVCDVTSGTHADPELVKGAPNGSLTEGYVSLGGGFVAGEFDNQVQILPGYTVTVYEIGDDFCAGIPNCVGDEKYAVSVITELGCLSAGGCEERVITGTGGASGEAEIPLSGF
ncbi:MAG: hypothetical protein U1F43_22335 [Myxococcota bacterium]